MMAAAALFVATVAAIELLRALGLMASFHRLGQDGRRATRLLVKTGVSEWAKERALRLMSARLLGRSLATGGGLLLVANPILLVIGVDILHPVGIRAALTDWPVRIWLLALTTAYILLRRSTRTALGSGERVFQRIALGNVAVLDTSFTIERILYRRHIANNGRPPVFIAGLARAGTTILTRLLHDSGDFASLSYRDLPFPLAPNAWARIGRGADRHVAAHERGHADGLLHDLDSPEAIEELFWRCQEGDRYIRPEGLTPVPPRPDSIAAFRDYVRLVEHRYGRTRYLSKNNANILRLPALVEAFPDAVIVHPFRDPIEQAASLQQQHLRACAMAVEDPFRADFMRWLGHHEFGAAHRPYLLSETPRTGGDTGSLDYWLKIWIDVHTFLLAQPANVQRRQLFVSHDRLCAAPSEALATLAKRLELSTPLAGEILHVVPRRSTRRVSRELMAVAYALHNDLMLRSNHAPSGMARAC
jgi:hypothetical protein